MTESENEECEDELSSRNESRSETQSEEPEEPEERSYSSFSIDDVSDKIGVLPLAALIFFSVAGGPIGIEETVRSGGFLWCLLGFIIAPFIWSVPSALMTAELGSTYPEASGHVAWVEEAFGSTAGIISGYLSWVAGATDNAIYPALFLDFLRQGLSAGDDNNASKSLDDMNGFVKFLLLAALSVILALVNFMGLKVVGYVSIAACVFTLLPFAVMCLVGLPKVDPSRWLLTPEDERGVMWRPLLNNLFWCLSSFGSAGNFAGDVQDPAKVLPRGILLAVALSVSSYILPLSIAVGATNGVSSDWVDGYIVSAASQIAGPWLGIWIVLAAGVCNISLFQAELSGDAFQLLGMAERRLVPRVFATRSRFGTPTYSLLLGTAVIVVLCTASFPELVEMTSFNSSISLVIEYAAFVKLRISKSEVHRPFRVPLNTSGCILLVIPPCCLTMYLMTLAQWKTLIYSFISMILGCVLFGIQSVMNKDEADTENELRTNLLS